MRIYLPVGSCSGSEFPIRKSGDSLPLTELSNENLRNRQAGDKYLMTLWLIRRLGRAEGFAVVAGWVETANPPLSRGEHVAGIADPLRSRLGLLG